MAIVRFRGGQRGASRRNATSSPPRPTLGSAGAQHQVNGAGIEQAGRLCFFAADNDVWLEQGGAVSASEVKVASYNQGQVWPPAPRWLR